MNYIDIVVAVAVVVGILGGLRKGLIREMAGLGAFVLSMAGARLFAPMLTTWVETSLDVTPEWSRIVAWVICFFGLGYALNLTAFIITRALGMFALGGVNKLLGAIFGGIKYILLFSMIFNLVAWASNHVEVPGKTMREQSVLYDPVKQVAGWSLDFMKRIQTDSEQPILKTVYQV